MQYQESRERPLRRVPVRLFLGEHADYSVPNLSMFDQTLGELLRQHSSKKILVVREDLYASETRARLIEQALDRGFSPSASVRYGLFAEIYRREPGVQDIAKARELFVTVQTKFQKAELKILDKHHMNGKRIRFIYETQHDEKRVQRQILGQDPKKNFPEAELQSSSAINRGEFTKGVEIFQKAIDSYFQAYKPRNPRFTEKIIQSAQDNDVLAIVGCLGAVHTAVPRALKKAGFDVSIKFAEKIAGDYLFDPVSSALRYKEFLPEKKLSEYQWYSLTIASALYGAMNDRQQNLPKKKRKASQEFILDLKKLIARMPTMEHFRVLETLVREKGMVEALFTYEQLYGA